MKSFIQSLLSMKSAVIFLLIFALANAIGTFVENDFGAQGSWALVYTSTWFAAIQVMLGLILVNNIIKYKMYKKNKLPAFIFHSGFIVILLASGITRYFGYEGSLHIREGKSENRIVSNSSFIQASATKDGKTYSISKQKLITSIASNDFTMKLDVDGKPALIEYKDFIPNATSEVVEENDGQAMISMMVSSDGSTKNVILKDGDIEKEVGAYFSLNSTIVGKDKFTVNFYIRDGKFYFKSDQGIGWFKMAKNTRGSYEPGVEYEFIRGQLYTIGDVNFAPKYIGLKGKEKIVSNKNPMQNNKSNSLGALIVDLTYDGKISEVAMYGMGKGSKGFTKHVVVSGVDFNLEWGSKVFELPFKIKLNDFQLDRYPGSMSPMAYASEVEVVDSANGVNMPYRIFMNHVLDYKGFRFFQSSYDTDERGTILSVNRDPGKFPTYLGYILLSIGLLLNLVNPKSRFRKIASMIQKDMDKLKSVLVAFLMAFALLHATQATAGIEESFDYIKKYDKAHADKFGEILVQSDAGRIKPIDTVSTEVLNKIYRNTSYRGLSANQVILSMMGSPNEWQVQPLIHVFHPELKKLLGLKANQKNATFNDFFEVEGAHAYKLQQYAEEANRKKPAERNTLDKDVIKVDERVNIAYFVFTGEIFKMIPKVGDPDHKWYSPKTAISTFPADESADVRTILAGYFAAMAKGIESGNWSEADKVVQKIKSYQEQYASEIMPSESRISTEMFFNKAQIFQRLTPFYLITGFVLLFSIFTKMIKPSISLKIINKIIFIAIILGFAAHTAGLGLRWYIAQHAPWSNGYESMVFIAWALALAGIFFGRKSIVALALTAIVTGVILFVAHLGWMDPQITQLVPVLNSYWLKIHVSVITSSYGFFGLSSLLGFFTLILFIIKKPNDNSERGIEIERNIVEATRINEMAMILGLTLLTIGNFLGGVWANESWGRYWGWDSKEVWALVSILVYAAIVHFRFIPALKTQFAFAVASTVAFASILMTYFGVNFYLSGMHSYASGDPVPIPTFVYYSAAIILTVIALAYRHRKLSKTL